MIDEYSAADTITGDILDILVMHNGIDQTIAKELPLHLVEDFLPADRIEADPIISDDRVNRITQHPARLLAAEVPAGDIEGLKEALPDLLEEVHSPG